ncbi:S-adenosyl-L-methionine-dependent methyltransferase [Trametes elegans]|nr:S-adenosyl-L-methionine-dependent methyltransferase [Trametes elegans]
MAMQPSITQPGRRPGMIQKQGTWAPRLYKLLDMTFSTLRALHATIGKAIDDLERVYRSQEEPLDFPPMDEPYYATETHDIKGRIAEQLKEDSAASFASQEIVAACGQLSAAVHNPWYGFTVAAQGIALVAALRFLEAAHIVEILKDAGPGGLHIRDVLRMVVALQPQTDLPDPEILNASRLAHILRLLATSHWLREVSPDVFTNNRRSAYLDSGKTLEQLRTEPENKHLGTDGVPAYMRFTGDVTFKWITYMNEWLLPGTRVGTPVVHAKGGLGGNTRPAVGDVEATPPSEENHRVTPFVSAFNIAFGTRLDFFSWLELPENRTRLQSFGHAMTGTRQWETKEGILYGFPWADLPAGAVLVDVGGGIGSTSLTVAEAHPHMKVIVEDRPQTVAVAPLSWGSQYAPLFQSGRMSWRARDIFGAWEPLESGDTPDVFLLRLVLHDWQDEDCLTILRHMRAGAGPKTTLLIGDMLLPYACGSDDGFVRDGSPLLPNMGAGNVHGYLMDVIITGLTGAKERTVAEMTDLMLSAGWKISGIHRSPGSLWAYTTAVCV